MRAVVKWKYQQGYDSLNTLHGWIGVITIIMFFFSYLFSNGVALGAMVLKSNLSSSTTWVHMCFAIISLGLTFVSIITGVEAWNGLYGCRFVPSRMDSHHTALNSAFYYGKHTASLR
jgi:protein-S-isoprenylcysteine O-methyltransferase Ste14